VISKEFILLAFYLYFFLYDIRSRATVLTNDFIYSTSGYKAALSILFLEVMQFAR